MTRVSTARRLAAVGFMSAVLLVPQAPVNAHSFLGETTVTIGYRQGRFYGSVASNRTSCMRWRIVKLVRKVDGRRLLVAQTRSNLEGNYSFNRRMRRGSYHVRVPRRVRGGYGHAHRCAFDRSPAI